MPGQVWTCCRLLGDSEDRLREFDFPASARFATPFAVIAVFTRNDKLVGLRYLPRATAVYPARDRLSLEACRQIVAYVSEPEFRFDLPCEPSGTEFQLRVWREIARIPVRQTKTYGDLARALKSAPRPVGGACGSNPIPLVVPCHRVVAANGALGGFMHSRARAPLDIKRWLLAHEAG
jgi:methylated-DNA-[protein]-cysteine S-methyltransferase